MNRFFAFALSVALSSICLGQTWTKSYEDGLEAAGRGDWAAARTDFQRAASQRPGDSAVSTPNSTSTWRAGAPYSPNFSAAYCGLKEAIGLTGDARKALLDQVAPEFESLLDKREYCQEIFFFLDETYVLLGQSEKRITLGQMASMLSQKASWKVDAAAIAEDDRELLSQLQPSAGAGAAVRTANLVKKDAPDGHTGPNADTKPRGGEKATTAPAEATSATGADMGDLDSKDLQVKDSWIAKTNAQAILVSAPSDPPAVPAVPTLPAQAPQDPISSQSTLAPLQPAVPTLTTPPQSPAHGHVNDAKQNSNGAVTGEKNTHPASQNNERHGKQRPEVVKPVKPKEAPKAAGKVKGSPEPEVASALPDKFAIIIGNSESKMDGAAIPFAADDAQLVRQTLLANCGYDEANVEIVLNGTAAQIAASVNALASRVPDKAAVLIYFTGVGENIDGKDYLAGVDSDARDDSSTMILKDDIYKAFMDRGARIFAFYQTNRPITGGRYFGGEVPIVGSISQMEATLPGQNVYGIEAGGKEVGLFTNSFVSVLGAIHSNQTPILEFGWQVFYRLRRGDTGSSGGSSNQSPSLPVLTNMASDARF